MKAEAGTCQISQVAPPGRDYDEDDFYDDTEDARCMTCLGEGYEDCEDTNSSEGCWERDCNGRFHICPNCEGSGHANDQYW